jgi:hypothetical protein
MVNAGERAYPIASALGGAVQLGYRVLEILHADLIVGPVGEVPRLPGEDQVCQYEVCEGRVF